MQPRKPKRPSKRATPPSSKIEKRKRPTVRATPTPTPRTTEEYRFEGQGGARGEGKGAV